MKNIKLLICALAAGALAFSCQDKVPAGVELTIDPSDQVYVSGRAQDVVVTVATDASAWDVTATSRELGWYEVSKSGDKAIFTLTKNEGAKTRVAECTFSANGKNEYFVIKQRVFTEGDAFAISEESPKTISMAATSFFVNVLNASAWTCESKGNYDWISVATSENKATFTVAENATEDARTAEFAFVAEGENPIPFVVRQEGIPTGDVTMNASVEDSDESSAIIALSFFGSDVPKIAKWGVCYSTTNATSGATVVENAGVPSSNESVTVSGLTLGNTYYFFGFFQIEGKKVSYSPAIEVKIVKPELANIGELSLKASAHSISAEFAIKEVVSEYGICWSTEPEPKKVEGYYTAGSGAEVGENAQICSISNPLIAGSTEYFVRGYVVKDGKTRYGEQASVTTWDDPMDSQFDINATPNTWGDAFNGVSECGPSKWGSQGYHHHTCQLPLHEGLDKMMNAENNTWHWNCNSVSFGTKADGTPVIVVAIRYQDKWAELYGDGEYFTAAGEDWISYVYTYTKEEKTNALTLTFDGYNKAVPDSKTRYEAQSAADKALIDKFVAWYSEKPIFIDWAKWSGGYGVADMAIMRVGDPYDDAEGKGYYVKQNNVWPASAVESFK